MAARALDARRALPLSPRLLDTFRDTINNGPTPGGRLIEPGSSQLVIRQECAANALPRPEHADPLAVGRFDRRRAQGRVC
ncbi:unnamed protein product, partial [Iphiclides podalirius]